MANNDPYHLDELAPPLVLPLADGEEFTLAEHLDRATLVTFLSHAA